MDSKMAVMLLQGLLERGERDKQIGSVSSFDLAALRIAIDALAEGGRDQVTPAQLPVVLSPAPPTKAPTVVVQAPRPPASPVLPAYAKVGLRLDSLGADGGGATPTGESDYLMCLDFGTAMSKAFAYDGRNQHLELELGTAAGREGHALPSSVYIADSGRVHFGFEAVEMSLQPVATRGRQRLDSIKQFISLRSDVSLDDESRVLSDRWNPTGVALTEGDMIRLYLAYLTDKAGQCMARLLMGDVNSGRYIRRRFARPCGPNEKQAQWVNDLMTKMLAQAQVLADTFEHQWDGGIPIQELKSALDQVKALPQLPVYLIDEGVAEPVAVAASAMVASDDARQMYMVMDAGAGTTDFGLFLAQRRPGGDDDEAPKVFQLKGSVKGIPLAGDRVDQILQKVIVDDAAIDSSDPASAVVRVDLSQRIRSFKEVLFQTGRLEYTLQDGNSGVITLKDFQSHAKVVELQQKLESEFKAVLEAVDGSYLDYLAHERVRLKVVLTGGSSALPMIQALGAGVIDIKGRKILRQKVDAAPEWLREYSPELREVYPQLAVAIGGVADELPVVVDGPDQFGGGMRAHAYLAR